MSRRRSVVAAAIALAACATGEPMDVSLGAVTELVEVRVLGDGFVRCGGRRQPREALVLTLRQRARAMSADELAGLRVEIQIDRAGGDGASRDADWLLDEIQILGVGQAKVRLLP